MNEDKEYKEGDEFFEVAFDIPKEGVDPKKIATIIMETFKEARNIVAIPCKVAKEPRRLSVSRDDYSYTLYGSKHKSIIIKEE